MTAGEWSVASADDEEGMVLHRAVFVTPYGVRYGVVRLSSSAPEELIAARKADVDLDVARWVANGGRMEPHIGMSAVVERDGDDARWRGRVIAVDMLAKTLTIALDDLLSSAPR